MKHKWHLAQIVNNHNYGFEPNGLNFHCMRHVNKIISCKHQQYSEKTCKIKQASKLSFQTLITHLCVLSSLPELCPPTHTRHSQPSCPFWVPGLLYLHNLSRLYHCPMNNIVRKYTLRQWPI